MLWHAVKVFLELFDTVSGENTFHNTSIICKESNDGEAFTETKVVYEHYEAEVGEELQAKNWAKNCKRIHAMPSTPTVCNPPDTFFGEAIPLEFEKQ